MVRNSKNLVILEAYPSDSVLSKSEASFFSIALLPSFHFGKVGSGLRNAKNPEAITSKRKKSPSEKSKLQPAADGDHRKRRRNRTTQSCLNCHTSKRMCDRKRPACARCTQLGLTGLCVYEVDDPNQRSDTQDESSRLLKRVAELEGVIRELKNKPHPRWVSSTGSEHDDLEARPPSPNSTPPSLRGMSPSQTTGNYPPQVGVSPLNSPSPPTPNDSASSHARVNDDSSGLAYNMDLGSIFDPSQFTGYEDNVNAIQHSVKSPYCNAQSCNCVLDATTYHAMLELSLRLRRAAGLLAQSPLHQAGGYCLLNQRLAELDAITTNTLSSVDSPQLNLASYGVQRTYSPSAGLPSPFPTTFFASSDPASNGLDQWLSGAITDAGSDSFMSWKPAKI
ncbi:hypothetical protein GYMLUDRAFT_37461 [Collybiopsis luxurians FD-317 M1]|nr:hypothetical protein GYMLUDRAFT_37461 [Collybiopsis luxurians FD-317 M1]